MHTVHTISEVRSFAAQARREGKTVGLVPTMGALHEGHASLIRRAVDRCEYVVVSIFVNPLQFGANEDLDAYPRTLEADLAMASRLSADLVFAPSIREMYSPRQAVFVDVERLDERMCGRSRPGHFRGVCTVVAKLFNIVRPDVAFFGQKDAQQAVIIGRMIEDLNFPVELEVLPTVREPDGLALSSRNRYLDEDERAEAACLHRALEAAFQSITRGQRDAEWVRRQMLQIIEQGRSGRVDYIELVDAQTLEPVADLSGRQVLIALAVFIGSTRLIDNIVVDVPG